MMNVLRRIDGFMVDAVDAAVHCVQVRWGVHYATVQFAASAALSLLVGLVFYAVAVHEPFLMTYVLPAMAVLLAFTVALSASTHWRWRNDNSPECFMVYWTVSSGHRSRPGYRILLIVFLSAIFLQHLWLSGVGMFGSPIFSQGVLALLPFLLAQYVLCARPVPLFDPAEAWPDGSGS